MKRLITTAGLAALGAASVAPTCAQDAMINQKPWSIGASLRGFYDDNYLTYPRALRDIPGFDEDTFGFDVAPSAAINLKRDQTTFGLSYLYTLRYYIDREDQEMDHTHQANLKLSHAFNERFSIDVKDSFVIAQEPSIIDPTIATTLPARAEGDNFRNFGSIQFNAAVVENFSVNAGYRNSIFDYEQSAKDIIRPANPTGEGSRSAVLDRMEHLFFVDGNYQVLPKTTVSLGYQFGINDFTSDDPLFGIYNGSVRDSRSHFATVGVKQHLNPQLDVSVRGGIQYTTYDNETFFDDQVSPYAEASLRWGYMEGSSLQVGARHQRIPTDVRLVTRGGVSVPIADQQATTAWVSVNQAITGKLSAIIMGQYQYSTYGDSSATDPGDAVDQIFFAGATLAYQFNPHISAEAGYTFDRVDSDDPFRSFTRNRFYVGTRLSY
ncbi:MAG TPA: outer membrane beta-barrel protein [Verrucomicrobiae bacterium]|nr:outer membrane beta-barrel protein [Verrucomicrobiae bacterium]